MKLLYATSFRGTSGLANRVQVLAMAKALNRMLPGSFYVGAAGIERVPADTPVVNFSSRRSWRLARRYLRFIRANGVDVVYSREGRLLFFMALYNTFAFRLPVRFVYEIHALSYGGPLERFTERALSRWSDTLVFVTAYLRDRYVTRYRVDPRKTFVAPDGVDLEIFDISTTQDEARKKLDLPLDKKIIGYCGRFRTMGEEKGIEDMLEAVKLLPADVVFVAMGGKPRDVDYYQMRVRELGVGERAIIRGHFTQDIVALYQKAADVLVMPFPWTEHYAYEMSPMKMFEYMASGRPIVTTDLPSVREVLNDQNALFCRPDDPKDFAEKIETLLGDEVLAERLAAQARRDAEHYTWIKRADNMLIFLAVGNEPS